MSSLVTGTRPHQNTFLNIFAGLFVYLAKSQLSGSPEGEQYEEKVKGRGDAKLLAKGDEADYVDKGVQHQLRKTNSYKT